MSDKYAIRDGDAEAVLDVRTWKWSGDKLLAGLANTISATYTYSSGDGVPGCVLVHMVAEKLEVEALVPPPPKFDPKVVY